jgi:glycosyltransferase involved in cell wall biosynthesis
VLIGIDASRAVVAQRTGTEAYSLHLIRALLRQGHRHRFRLYVNTPPAPDLFSGDAPLDPARCEVRHLPFPRLWTHLRLSAEMLFHSPDVLFVPSHVLPLCHPRRSVVTVHDLGHRHYPQAHTTWQRWYLEWSTRYHVRTAAHLVADSRATKHDLVRLYGVDPRRVTVAYLGVDPAFQPVRDPQMLALTRTKYGISRPYVLYLGTLQPRKNLARLIEAFGQIVQPVDRASHPGAALQLVLAGKRGWLCGDILARARALGVGDRVIITGYVEETDLAALYSGASLFVMPSLYEGFCIPVLEAMACGVPVACSNVSSLPEVAGSAALLFDPLDVEAIEAAMVRVLQDEELCRSMVQRGFEQVQDFTWTRCAQTVLAVLERVQSASSRRVMRQQAKKLP